MYAVSFTQKGKMKPERKYRRVIRLMAERELV
jgi:hypothetical protein